MLLYQLFISYYLHFYIFLALYMIGSILKINMYYIFHSSVRIVINIIICSSCNGELFQISDRIIEIKM